MINLANKKILNVILVVFTILDLTYSVICFAFPEFWFSGLHSAAYVDPQGLLRRTGAVWAAFAIFHFIAIFKWQKHAYWLAIIAGMRFSELFADWTYLYFAESVSFVGRIGLLITPPVNFLVCLYLLKSYLQISQKR